MKETAIAFCTRIIEYSFYSIFLLVPLVFTSTTSELFEFNKMWLTFGLTLIIAAAWFSKMILQKKLFMQKTPLDIPIALFLLSQIISTLVSIDQHISLWGYYSRFNGGLLSMIAYIFLYYAFVSNFGTSMVKRSLIISIVAGTIVALWGLPSHFGYDPTCWLFRGTFDVSCWTDQFQPKIRIFSTLGQPNWMAAYLAILLPLTLTYGINYFQSQSDHEKKNNELRIKNYGKTKEIILASLFFILTSLFYIDILYTGSQSGFVGAVAAIILFTGGYVYLHWKEKIRATKIAGSIIAVCLFIAFVLGQPILQLSKFSLANIQKTISTPSISVKTIPTQPAQAGTALEGGTGGTSSGEIRKNVWTGAINMWKDNPLFGTGVETFAFAYYRYRPVAHNMTSEWDYLYNKAHNEYLNYLATTGAFGLGSYLLMIGMFLWITIIFLIRNSLILNHKSLLILALLAGYISILVSNFFGFSVVILNIYLFLIPAFVFLLANKLIPEKSLFALWTKPSVTESKKTTSDVSSIQWICIVVIWCIALFEIWTLYNFWMADQAFALAQNYNRIGQYETGFKKIREAVALRSDEPTFAEEQATSDAIIAVALAGQKQELAAKQAQQLSNEAITIMNQLTTDYPNNTNFLKSQVRVYYTLSQLNPVYLQQALQTMKKTAALAPTDAKIWYNLGVLYGQTGQTQKGVDVLQKTIQLKPDYREAYFALGLFYHDLALDKNGKVIKPEMQQQAVEEMNYILTHFSNKDKAVLDTLKSWST